MIVQRKRFREHGFTLIELAIVLTILSLLLVGVLGPLRTQIESRDRDRAQQQLEEIKEAVLGFAEAQGRLPCPDVNDNGQEDPPGGAGGCTNRAGDVPWRTLGVTRLDPWNTTYRYRVADNFEDSIFPATITPPVDCTTPAGQSSFALCTDGDITIQDGTGVTITDNIPAVVLSYGANRNDPGLAIGGTLSAHEAENVSVNAIFISKGFSRDDTEEFDDLVVWISLNILKNRMVAAGRLP